MARETNGGPTTVDCNWKHILVLWYYQVIRYMYRSPTSRLSLAVVLVHCQNT